MGITIYQVRHASGTTGPCVVDYGIDGGDITTDQFAQPWDPVPAQTWAADGDTERTYWGGTYGWITIPKPLATAVLTSPAVFGTGTTGNTFSGLFHLPVIKWQSPIPWAPGELTCASPTFDCPADGYGPIIYNPYPATPYPIYSLSADRNPFGLTRMVYNSGFAGSALALRRYFDLEVAADDVALTITGQSPDIVCLSDGTHLVFRSDGTNIQLSRIDDEGVVVQTMASPGSGKLVCGHIDPAGLCLWEAHCTADTGTGDIVVRRNFDVAGIGATWETISGHAAGLPTSGYTPDAVPAQVPRLTGDSGELNLSYHDSGGNIRLLRSIDLGATWGAV